MKRTTSLVLIAVIASAAVPVAAQERWGSIAFSQTSGGGYAWGMAWSYGSHSAARRDAINECRRRGGGNCSEIAWFHDACGALAVGSNNGSGSGWGTSTSIAESYAIQSCRSYGNRNCRVVISRCSR